MDSSPLEKDEKTGFRLFPELPPGLIEVRADGPRLLHEFKEPTEEEKRENPDCDRFLRGDEIEKVFREKFAKYFPGKPLNFININM